MFDLRPQQGKAHLPIIEFVAELARTRPDLKSAIEEWQEETATALRWTRAEITLREGQAGTNGDRPSAVYILIEIGYDPSDRSKKLYKLDIRLWVGEKPLPSLFCKRDYGMTIDEIHKQWDETFMEIQGQLDMKPENVYLEFIVPCELLSYPFEAWEIPGALYETYGTIYPVVVGSYDRLNLIQSFKQKWRERTIKAKQVECTFEDQNYTRWVCEPNTQEPRALYRTWHTCQELVCLKLVYQPVTEYMAQTPSSDSAAIWLQVGVPVAVWCRSTAALNLPLDEIRNQISDLIGKETSLTKLPQRLIAVRFDADGQADKLGSHLVLFWDDATRRPSLHNEAPVFAGL